MKKLSLAYGAGTLGAVANFTFGLILSTTGLLNLLGVYLPPQQMPAALYQRLVWGGIWGILLYLPLWKGDLRIKGLLIGVLPSLVAGLLVFPSRGGGLFGHHFGAAFPALIFIFNWVWGIITIWCYRVMSR